jgi:uncharacterized NAD(P)/FAD-binding protein YdhS
MLSDTAFSVVIAGGGFCGMMTLVNLARKADREIKIVLINKEYKIARGIAFKSYSDLHVLNVEARNMSAFPDQPDHFIQWCENHPEVKKKKSEIPFTFFPRNLYGSYLDDIFNNTIKNLPDFVTVEILTDEVSDIKKSEDQLIVFTSGGKKFIADKVVLATGNSEPGPPNLSDKSFLNSKKYFPNPWKEEAVTGLSNDSAVLIIGAGLTMVDVIIGLIEKNYTGKIISLSPHGFNILPHKKSRPQRYILDELSPPYTLENLFRLFYKHIRQARKHGETGETVVDAIRAKTQEIWQELTLDDKKKFMTHLRHLWGVARHRLPAYIHQQMQFLIKDGKLKVIAGRIIEINEPDNDVEVHIQKRKDQTELVIHVARVINCTGPQTDIRRQNCALYNNLTENGMIRPDEMNLGVDATANGQVIDSSGNISDQLFAIGSLLKGKLWESTAVPELRLQAMKVAEQIISMNVEK